MSAFTSHRHGPTFVGSTVPGVTTSGTTVGSTPNTTTASTTDAHSHSHSHSNSNATHGGEKVGEGIKGIFAKGHGIGEALRGNINSAIDSLTGDKAGVARNEQIAHGGEREFQTGHFEKKGTTDKAL